jgi:hypothetical protein
MDSLQGLLELRQNQTRERFILDIDSWTRIEDSNDFAKMQHQNLEREIAEDAHRASLVYARGFPESNENDANTNSSDSDSDSDSREEYQGIHSLDVAAKYNMLVQLQEDFEVNGLHELANSVKASKDLLIETCYQAEKKRRG